DADAVGVGVASSPAGTFRPACAQGRVKPTAWPTPSPGGESTVPKCETRTGKPVAYASIIVFLPITMPTCPGFAGVPSAPAKNTRSPGETALGATFGPHAHCAAAVRGMSTPAAR